MADLTRIPGVGKNMAQRLTSAGYPNIESLKGQCPICTNFTQRLVGVSC